DRRRSVLALAAFIGAALPLIVYDAVSVQRHPALAAWNRQNLTPSPALLETVLAFLPLLAFSAVALANPDNRRAPHVRYLAVWSIVTLGLLYAPIGLQRRLALGVYVPLAALGAMAVDAASRWMRSLPILALLLTLPSHAIVAGAGVSSVQQGDPILVLGRDELAAYRWMDDGLPSGSLVLAGPRAGNRIPAYTDLRVVYGHPFETPNASGELAWVQSMYAWSEEPEGALARLRDRGVTYIYVGPEERSLGEPAWLESLEAVFTEGEVTVYEVAPE
ncbi:MAG TPA: hypothetical protein VFI11_08190, partial [Anaerolineales bacterium]|nr:hypothetical protein [Anaerolineales bacterium]